MKRICANMKNPFRDHSDKDWGFKFCKSDLNDNNSQLYDNLIPQRIIKYITKNEKNESVSINIDNNETFSNNTQFETNSPVGFIFGGKKLSKNEDTTISPATPIPRKSGYKFGGINLSRKEEILETKVADKSELSISGFKFGGEILKINESQPENTSTNNLTTNKQQNFNFGGMVLELNETSHETSLLPENQKHITKRFFFGGEKLIKKEMENLIPIEKSNINFVIENSERNETKETSSSFPNQIQSRKKLIFGANLHRNNSKQEIEKTKFILEKRLSANNVPRNASINSQNKEYSIISNNIKEKNSNVDETKQQDIQSSTPDFKFGGFDLISDKSESEAVSIIKESGKERNKIKQNFFFGGEKLISNELNSEISVNGSKPTQKAEIPVKEKKRYSFGGKIIVENEINPETKSVLTAKPQKSNMNYDLDGQKLIKNEAPAKLTSENPNFVFGGFKLNENEPRIFKFGGHNLNHKEIPESSENQENTPTPKHIFTFGGKILTKDDEKTTKITSDQKITEKSTQNFKFGRIKLNIHETPKQIHKQETETTFLTKPFLYSDKQNFSNKEESDIQKSEQLNLSFKFVNANSNSGETNGFKFGKDEANQQESSKLERPRFNFKENKLSYDSDEFDNSQNSSQSTNSNYCDFNLSASQPNEQIHHNFNFPISASQNYSFQVRRKGSSGDFNFSSMKIINKNAKRTPEPSKNLFSNFTYNKNKRDKKKII